MTPPRIAALPWRIRAILALLPAHVRDEHEREIVFALQDGEQPPGVVALALDVLRAAPAAHLDVLRQDLGLALRQIRRSPVFALIAVITLSLGLGGNLAFFTLVDGVLFRPLPWRGADRLVTLSEENLPRGMASFGLSPANFRDYGRDTTLFAAATAWQVRPATLRSADDAERVITAAVTGGFFQVFLEAPVLGRRLDSSDDIPGGDAVVVSERFFSRVLGSDRRALPADIVLDGSRLRVVGVMPASFGFPTPDVDVWRPLAMPESEWQRRGSRYLGGLARLRDGVTVTEAAQRLGLLATSLSASFPETNTGWTILVRDLRTDRVDAVRSQLYLIWAAGAMVLLVAVANAAGLFIARAVTRQREFAVRSALGARTGRVARQVFTEALVLTLVGSAIGVGAAMAGLSWIRITATGVIPRITEVAIGSRAVGLSLAIAVAAAFLLTALTLPAMRRVNLWGALGGGRGGISTGRWRLLRGIVASEVALACFVLIGTSLVTRSLRGLLDQPMGFQPSGVTTFRVEVPFHFRGDQPPGQVFVDRAADQRRVVEQFDAMLEAIGGRREVQSVGAISRLPLTGNYWTTSVGIVERPGTSGEDREAVWIRPVTAGYLETMGTRLRRGRFLERFDREGAERVVVVDEAFAHRVWGDTDPVGKELALDGPPGVDVRARIVGVVESVHMNRLDADLRGAMYVPFPQSLEGFFPNWGLDIVVRRGDTGPIGPADLAAFRQLARDYLPDAVVFNLSSMDRLVAVSVADRRFQHLVLGVLSALSLLLATVGVSGALTLIVRERSQELAIRQALGARSIRVWWHVQAGGLAVAGVGAAAGVAIALAGARVFSSLVYGISVRDPASFVAAPVILCLAAFLAAGIPATRAARVSPTAALREN